MSIIERLIRWFRYLVAPAPRDGQEVRGTLPPVAFPQIICVEKPPRNGEVKKDVLYLVAPGQRPKWALFQCPCGCQSVITLSLQSVHQPHWSLMNSSANRPILSPSVWRDVGCLSHFWIKDGRVFWCQDTGTQPYL